MWIIEVRVFRSHHRCFCNFCSSFLVFLGSRIDVSKNSRNFKKRCWMWVSLLRCFLENLYYQWFPPCTVRLFPFFLIFFSKSLSLICKFRFPTKTLSSNRILYFVPKISHNLSKPIIVRCDFRFSIENYSEKTGLKHCLFLFFFRWDFYETFVFASSTEFSEFQSPKTTDCKY